MYNMYTLGMIMIIMLTEPLVIQPYCHKVNKGRWGKGLIKAYSLLRTLMKKDLKTFASQTSRPCPYYLFAKSSI